MADDTSGDGDSTNRDSDGRLDDVVERLFEHARPRRDVLADRLLQPHQPAPLLLQGPETFMVLALGSRLLSALAERGASAVRRSRVDALRDAVRERFDESTWHHVENEVSHILLWLEHALSADSREADAASPLEWDPAPRRALIEQAIDDELDLYLEFIDRDAMRYHRIRLRPERVVERSHERDAELEREVVGASDTQPTLVAARVPDGEPIELALSQIRWMMLTHRLSEIDDVELAPVLRFPGPESD